LYGPGAFETRRQAIPVKSIDRSQTDAAAAEPVRIDPAKVAALYVEHGQQLRSFLLGVLRDEHLAGDVLQLTFVKLLEQGHTARNESLKGWLFRVAYHEAMIIRRREGVQIRATERLARETEPHEDHVSAGAVRSDLVRQVQRAVEGLSPAQKEVVRLRIYEQMKFADVATALNVPLGTALARMRAALKQLRQKLGHDS
jgi:RNA polymerase sigma-70 factor (ECF subfamily)